MNCAEFEIRLADYIDATLDAAERAALEQHAATCAGCRDLLNDAIAAAGFLQRSAVVLPPPELITRIAFQAPVGRTRHPFERQNFLSRWIGKWLQPVLQPRLAMGMAMTILSFAMLERCTGVRVQHIDAADLSPVRIWGGVEDKAFRVKDRAVKYYENLRWVYEIETRLQSLQQQQDASPNQSRSSAANSSAGTNDRQTNSSGQAANAPGQGENHK